MSPTATLEDSLESLRQLQPSSPKRRSSVNPSADWYAYYAGYADGFVKDIVGVLPKDALTILDPWNGSGTTTAVATLQSVRSKGFDMNPAAVVIAKARILRSDVAGSIAALTDEILDSAPLEPRDLASSDLLETWLTPEAASHIRSVEIRIRRLLIGADAPRVVDSAGEISSLAALFYLGLFRSVRKLLGRFVGSNPTWIRRRVDGRRRLRPSRGTVHDLFRSAMGELTALVEAASNAYDDQHCPCDIQVGSSLALPLEENSIDAVITSPPYCTRIDYVVATLPELAVLGLLSGELKELRDKMIGTPTMAPSTAEAIPQGCNRAADLLDQVSAHGSKASAGYYHRFFSRYFDGMHRSLREVRRVAKDGAPAVLVVQDSYYKELHVDLAAIIEDMAATIGWTPLARHDFQVIPRRNYATINPRSRAYRQKTEATESVLVLGAS